MSRGDHIYVYRDAFKGVRVGRTLYTHHAIDMGDETVIEFVSDTDAKRDSVIVRRQLDDFAQSGRVGVREYGRRFDGETAATRAESMLGTAGYDFFTNNCEHFASWCVTGQLSSSQIENGVASAGLATTTAVAPAVGVELVGTFGSAAVRSGPNVMSGLSAIGGTAVGGIAVLGGASGLIATGVMCRALADKPTLPTAQREARQAGRQASLGGAVLGTGAAVYAVGAMGVPGFSGAGISSGLAALGSLTGGGMVRGLSTTVIIPALFAVLLGYLIYRHTLHRRAALPASHATVSG
jgi:hypothetical protein